MPRFSPVVDDDLNLYGSLHAAQAQAEELRTLHTAIMVGNMQQHHPHYDSQYHQHHSRGGGRHQWKTPLSNARRQGPPVSPSSSTAGACAIRPTHDYPIFTPSSEELMFSDGSLSTYTEIESRRSSIDARESIKAERLSYILDNSKRSLSTLNGRGAARGVNSHTNTRNYSTMHGTREQNHVKPVQKPLFELITEEASRKKGGGDEDKASMGMAERPAAEGGQNSNATQADTTVEAQREDEQARHMLQRGSIQRTEDMADKEKRYGILRVAQEGTVHGKGMAEGRTMGMGQKGRLESGSGEAICMAKMCKDSLKVGDGRRGGRGISCDKCRPSQAAKMVVPLYDSRDFSEARQAKDGGPSMFGGKGGGVVRAWFAKVRRKGSTAAASSGVVTHVEASARSTFSSSKEHSSVSSLHTEVEKELEVAMAMDLMELKLSQAHTKREAAVSEVVELRVAMQAMAKKVGELEVHCKGLKEELAMRRYMSSADVADDEDDGGASHGGLQPRYAEFLHAVGEARAHIKQLCRALRESGCVRGTSLPGEGEDYPPREDGDVELEACLSLAFFEYFENVAFHRNGAHTNALLPPTHRALSSYRSYLRLTRVPASDLLDQRSPSHDAAFRRFCARKLAAAARSLHSATWPDDVAGVFHVAARSVWILHLLALSFQRPSDVSIFRVGGGAFFDARFMEGVTTTPQAGQVGAVPRGQEVRLMVTPGFFAGRSVIKCKVRCRDV